MKPYFLPLCLLMLLLSACEREDRFGSALPVIFQIDQLQLSGGDTITITGDNFSENAANNLVTFNGIQALIVSSSFRDLVVVVPERAGAGQLVVSTRAGRSNEFPYRYRYQIIRTDSLSLGGEVALSGIRRIKIINNEIFLISSLSFTPPSGFTKIYRFRFDGSAVPESPNPLQISNFSIGAIAADAQGNFIVSARDLTNPPSLFTAGRLYSLNLAQATLSPLPEIDDVRAIINDAADPNFAAFSDIQFDSQGNLYYTSFNNGDLSLIRRSPAGAESIVVTNFNDFISDMRIAAQGEILLSIPEPLVVAINNQEIRFLLTPQEFFDNGGSDALFIAPNGQSNDLLVALGNRLFAFDRVTRRLENIGILPDEIRGMAMSEDRRLFVLTVFSKVFEVTYK